MKKIKKFSAETEKNYQENSKLKLKSTKNILDLNN
jgi:hypothetical protein